MMGVSRNTFYRYQEAVETGGIDALIDKNRRIPNTKNRVDPDIEKRVVEYAVEQPAHGQVRVSNELRKQGVFVSPSGVRSIWLRHQLENFKLRLKALENKSANLYQVEADIRDQTLTADAKQQYRVEYIKHEVESFFVWLKVETEMTALLPTNPFIKAAYYALKRQAQLSVFLENPEVPLDTNHLERALRVIPMGRKNWLFCWTEIGAYYVGVVQSLLTTCKLHKINPYDYLVDVLQRIDRHPMSRIEELTPFNWKKHFADNPLKSDLYRVWPNNLPPPI